MVYNSGVSPTNYRSRSRDMGSSSSLRQLPAPNNEPDIDKDNN